MKCLNDEDYAICQLMAAWPCGSCFARGWMFEGVVGAKHVAITSGRYSAR